MHTTFKRHQSVRLLTDANPEYVEYYSQEIPITKGMTGTINIMLPNGKYHVEIKDAQGEVLAYALLDESSLEAINQES